MNDYCVSTFSFRTFELDQFLGDLAEIGISTIELGKPHYETLGPQTAARLQAETGLHFKSMLTTEDIAAARRSGRAGRSTGHRPEALDPDGQRFKRRAGRRDGKTKSN